MNSTTTNLADFGSRERRMLIELLTAWDEQGLPENFNDEAVVPTMNQNSGNVFLTNEDFDVAMMHNGQIESFYSCPSCGHEGFKDEMDHLENSVNNLSQDLAKECQRYLVGIGIIEESDESEDAEPEESLLEA